MALVDQGLVGTGIVLANVRGSQHVAVLARHETIGDVKLDRATAASLEVNEQQPLELAKASVEADKRLRVICRRDV